MTYQCPNCAFPFEPLTRLMREAADRDFRRRAREAARKRERYATDPEYRAMRKAAAHKAAA